MVRWLLYILLILLASERSFCQGSVLKSGNWFKIATDKNGVYKLTPDQLRKLGIDVGKADPRNVRIYGGRGGMLPQPNASPRDGELVELAIKVKGEEDGVFNKGDFILFYGEGPDRSSFNPAKNVFLYQHNLYSDRNYYFITVSDSKGKRISELDPGTGGSAVTTFQDFVHYEKDEYNDLKSGREWFGERFETTNDYTFNFDIDGIVENSNIIVVSDVMAQSVSPSSFQIFFNDQLIGEQDVPVIPGSQYGVKGRHKRDTIIISAATVGVSQTRQQVKYTFTKGSSGKSTGFLDFFSLHFTRGLSLYGNQTIFRSSETLNQASLYSIANMNAVAEIWNITNPYTPARQKFNIAGTTATFSTNPESIVQEYISFNDKQLVPELIGKIDNQDLRGKATPHLLIITHPTFEPQAQRLAAHRSATNNWTVAVVRMDEVYHEFSSGKQDVTAIRDFVKHLYDQNPSVLKSLLLFGKCSYDYKDRIADNTNFIPTYESRNSLSPLETYSSDDYFAFLENLEGEWGENPFLQNHTLDIGVGRLPVKSLAEAEIVVNKLIEYDTNQKRFGPWRKDIVFVADDGSNSDGFTSIHQSQASSLADNIEMLHPEFNTRKIFLGTYPKIVSPNGEAIPQANKDIAKEFHQSVIINYTGHGSEKLWADERVLTQEEIENLDNKLYPFLVTATCEFGRQDNPGEISSAELSVLKESAGSIGLVTTARPVNSSTNFSLNAAFYQALLEGEGNASYTIGQIFQNTKNNSTSGVANRNFSMLGDPSMKLALPLHKIVIESIKTENDSDTLKALSKVIVKGQIQNQQGSTLSNFNGVLSATLFDKKTKFQTIGKNDPAFMFQQWFNPLFRGQASVTDGMFEFEFVLPKNIAYEINPGKLSLYAFDNENTMDASGSSSQFKVGGSEADVEEDNQSPLVRAFMEDETFINGGIVKPNTILVARVSDANGINISNYGIGNTMMAVLDNEAETYLLNEYFVSDVDDFTSGWIRMPLKDLEPGLHRITVKVWDTYNNPAEASVEFVVSEKDYLVIESLGNYPNPFEGETTIFFTHNRAGEDLETLISFYDMAGLELQRFGVKVPASTYKVDVMELKDIEHFQKKLPPGIYFCHLRVRSMADGAGSEQVTKLVVSK